MGDDEKLASDIETKITFYKAFRSYYIALAFIVSQKWAEAMAVFQRSMQYLAQYYEDPDMLRGKPNLVNFPPEFSPIPCKPLFFDIALNHVEFPSLDDKLVTEDSKAGAGGLSGWIWGWGWGK